MSPFDFIDSRGVSGCGVFSLLAGMLVFGLCTYCSPAVGQAYNWDSLNKPLAGSFSHVAVDSQNTLIGCLIGRGIYNSTDKGLRWNKISDYPGSITCIFVNERNHLFLGTADTGVLRTTDGGKSWSTRNAGLARLPIQVITQDAWGTMYLSTRGGGLYRSTDDGDTWLRFIAEPPDSSIVSIAVGPTGDMYAGTKFAGIFRSTDAGNFWTKILGYPGLSHILFNSKGYIFAAGNGAFRSTDGGTSWPTMNPSWGPNATCSLIMAPDEVLYASVIYEGVYKSTNDGASWIQLMPDDWAWIIINSLAMDRDGTLFAATSDREGNGVLVSTNNGNRWLQRGIIPITEGKAILEDDSGRIFLSTPFNGVFRSSDNGQSWGMVNHLGGINRMVAHNGKTFILAGHLWRSEDAGDTWKDVHEGPIFSFTSSTPGHLYVGGDGLILQSTDDGITWKQSLLPERTRGVFALLVNPNGNIIACVSGGIDEGGIFRSFNNGGRWDHPDNRFDARAICMDRNGKMFVGTAGDGIFQSTDEGLHWDPTNGLRGNPVRFMEMDAGENLIAGTANGVYESTDQGRTWSLSLPGSINCLSRGPGGFLYATTQGGGIYRSIVTTSLPRPPELRLPEDGKSCFPLTLDLLWHPVLAVATYRLQVATDPQFTTGLILDDSLVADTARRVSGLADTTRYYWRVRGRNVSGAGDWSMTRSFTTLGSAIQTPLPQSPPSGATVPWRNVLMRWNLVPCGAEYAIQVARDSVFQNMEVEDTIPLGNFYQIGKLAVNKTYYWRVRTLLSLLESPWSGISRFFTGAPTFIDRDGSPAELVVSEPSPNPAAYSSRIRYFLPKKGLVFVKLYDFLGRVVVSLFEGIRDAGHYDAFLGAQGLQSGIYFCRFTTGRSVVIKKVIVQK